MKEVVELRISDNKILKKIPLDLGIDLDKDNKYRSDGSISPLYFEIRKIEISTSDSYWKELKEMLSQPGIGHGFTGIKRYYSKEEIKKAEIFKINTSRFSVFEPTGIECGTVYDESKICPYCKVERIQKGDLILNLKKVPKNKDICKTIGSEFIISEKLKNILVENKITGIKLNQVKHYRGEYKIRYFQPIVISKPVKITKRSKFGMMFEKDENKIKKYICPRNHTKGLSLLSELFIDRSSWDGSDVAVTSQYWGYRLNLLYPSKGIIISPRLFNLMKENNIKGFDFEVAYLV